MAKVIDSDNERKSERERENQHHPGSDEFSNNGLPWCDRHGEEQLDRPEAPFLRPHPHSDRRDEEKIEPRMPGKKHFETRLSTLEKSAHHEGKKADEEEEDDDENIGHR